MLAIDKRNINQSHDWKFRILEKEMEVSSLIDKGYHDKEIKKYAHISEITLAKYRKNILRKHI